MIVIPVSGRFEEAARILEENITEQKAGAPAISRFINSCIESGRLKKASRMINTIPEEWYQVRNLSSAISWHFIKQGEADSARKFWDQVPYRPKLQVEKSMQVRLNRIHWQDSFIGESRLRLYTIVDDAQSDPEAFLDYYRSIGVEEFFIIDNGQSGQFRDFIITQSDCAVFETLGDHQEHCCGAYWVNYLKETYPHPGWDLFVGQNSRLVLPDIGAMGLGLHLDLMEARGEEVLSAAYLPLYDDLKDGADVPTAGISFKFDGDFQYSFSVSSIDLLSL